MTPDKMKEWNRPGPVPDEKEESAELTPQEGDYWEEDENGVVFLRRKDGTPVLMMSRQEYDDLQQWEEP